MAYSYNDDFTIENDELKADNRYYWSTFLWYKLVRFAHNWNDGTMEYWNIGSFLHRIEKHCDSW